MIRHFLRLFPYVRQLEDQLRLAEKKEQYWEEKYYELIEGNPKATKLSDIPCWYVSYRGSCFGFFMSENLAKDFSDFIKPRIDARASVTYPEWTPTVFKTNVLECLTRTFPKTYFEDVV